MADPAPGAGRPQDRMAAIGTGSGRVGDNQVGAAQGQHVARRLRDHGGRKRHGRSNVAAAFVSRTGADRVPGPDDHRSRSPRGQALAGIILVLAAFREIVLADCEFAVTPGNRPVPVCLVAHELRSGRRFRVWRDQFGPAPPYATGPDVLFVAYYASAELGCYRVLGWPMPERILDLFCEFSARTNGLDTPGGKGLLGALAYFGLDAIGASEKAEMRELVLRGGRWSETERRAILEYCEGDGAGLGRLLPGMLPGIDLPRALLRGRYMAAAAAMEHVGTPIDIEMLELFRQRWTDIKDRLIA